MWITYFPELITHEESTKFFLTNCRVVIDAENYVYRMYKLPFVFGCEANEFAKYLKNNFQMFKKAGVECYFVFKGIAIDIEKKINNINVLDFNFDSAYGYVPPIFVKDVFIQVLQEMKFKYAFGDADRRDDCVALARKLKCPVISNDIEFCFKNALYVPKKTLKYNDQTKYIECRKYTRRSFQQKHGLTNKTFAMFATLTDISIFPHNFFDALFHKWGVLNKYNYYIQNKQIIMWLSTHSEDEAGKDIMETLTNEDDKNKFTDYYTKLLENMQTKKPGIITNYFDNVEIVRQDPKWFEKGVALNIIPFEYINLYKWNIIEGSWAIEDKTSGESLLLSIDIIKYAYNLMKNYKRGQFKLLSKPEPQTIDTDETNIKKPSYECKDSVFENGWSNIKSLKLFEHFLSESKINVVALSELPEEIIVLFAALVYFARKKGLQNMDVKKEVYAVLLSHAILYVLFAEERHKKESKMLHLLHSNINDADCTKARDITYAYFLFDKHEASKIYDGVAMKRLVELQFCLLHMNYLNTLCGSPYVTSNYSRIFNGTFVYKVFWAMQEKDSDTFINELFDSAPSVLAFIKKMIKHYEDLLTKE